jgi:long-chain acyl-CoA synthetase
MGIYAKNREEWMLMDIANMKNSVTTIAFYDTLGPAAVEFVVVQTKLTTISCSSNYLPSLIKLKKDGKAESITNLISFDKFEDTIKEQAKEVGIHIYTFDEVVEAGKNGSDVKLNEPKKDDIYMFCYTSGTTGDPKAAMLSHGNLMSSSAATKDSGVDLGENEVYLSYLPLAHSLEKVLFTISVSEGCKIGFYSGDPLKLLEDVQVLKPTIFVSVPRLFNRIYDKITQGVKEKSPMQQWIFNKALNSKLYYL